MDKLIDALLEYNEGDWEETAEDIDDIYRKLRLAPSLIFAYWKERCFDEGKCCYCGADMVSHVEKEYRGEYQGSDVDEEVTYYRCSECGEEF